MQKEHSHQGLHSLPLQLRLFGALLLSIRIFKQMSYFPGGDDCLTNFLQQNYTGKVSVTNHGITCQHWISQTPHPHAFVTKDNPMKLLEDFNYCRSFESLNPWCFTMDPYIRWQYCTFSICNGTVSSQYLE